MKTFLFNAAGDGSGQGGGSAGGGGLPTLFGAANGDGQQQGGGGGGTPPGQGQQQPPGQGEQKPPGQGQQQQPPANTGEQNVWQKLTNAEGKFVDNWTEQLPDNIKAHATALSKYKTPDELMLGLVNAQQLIGQQGNKVTLPDDKAKPEVVSAYRKAVGAPENPDGYGFKKPDGLPDTVEWSDDVTKEYAGVMLKHHIPVAAAKELMALHVRDLTTSAQAEHEGNKAWLAKELGGLKTEWGDNFMANMKAAEAMVTHLGIDPQDPALMHSSVARALYKAHKMFTSEDGRVEGKVVTTLDPGAEAKRIMTDNAHPMYAKYQAGDKEASAHVAALLQRARK